MTAPTAGCYGCDWTAEGPDADRLAEKHCRATGHGTGTHGRAS